MPATSWRGSTGCVPRSRRTGSGTATRSDTRRWRCSPRRVRNTLGGQGISETTYARRLGLFSGTMAVIGGIIGGGIFRTPATVASRLDSPRAVLFAWVIGGAVALIGAFCFGELGQRRPREIGRASGRGGVQA